MAAWLSQVPSILGMLLVVVLPGALVLGCAGARRPGTFLGAPLVTFALLGLATLATAWVPWGAPWVLGATFIACGAAFACRMLLGREPVGASVRAQARALRSRLAALSGGAAPARWLAGGVLAAAVLAFLLFATAVPSPYLVEQNYDAPFHLSVVRHIVETGCASPVGAGSVMGSAGAVYPSLWHALAALCVQAFGAGVPASAWTVNLVLVMFVLPGAACALGHALFGFRRGFSFAFAAVVPVFAVASVLNFALFGPLYANLCGMAVLPFAVAYAIRALDPPAGRGGFRRVALRFAAALAVSVPGLGFAHPNTVFAFTIFLLPMLVARCRTARGRAAVLALFAACWSACLASPLFARTVNCLDRTGDDMAMGARLTGLLGIDYGSLATSAAFVPAAFAVIVACAAAVAFWARRRWAHSWYLAALGILCAQVVCALFPLNWFSVVATGFWYRDIYRIAYPLVTFCCIAGAFLPEALVGALEDRARNAGRVAPQRRAGLPGAAQVAALAMCALMAVGLVAVGTRSCWAQLRALTDDAARAAEPGYLSAERARFLQRVADEAGGAVVLNSHCDASVWLYPEYGVRALAKGGPANQITAMDDDYYLLVASIDRYGSATPEGQEVRRAARSLNVEYVVQMNLAPDMSVKFNADGTLDYREWNAVNEVQPGDPGLQLVFEQDGMRLFRLL